MNQHPDTEALSAYLDGEAPEWAAHVADCPNCRADVERLQAVALAVGQLVPAPNAADRDRAITRALEMAQVPPPAAGSDESTSESPVPLAPRPAPIRRSASGRSVRPVWMAVGSVAAAVLAVVGALSLVNRQDDGTDTRTALESPPGTGTTLKPQPGSGLAENGIVDGGELGELPDQDALVDRVARAVAGTDSRFSADTGDSNSPTAAAPAPADRSPSSETEGAASDAPPPNAMARIVGTRACELQARQVDPALRHVVYAATGQQGGEPVVVLGFALPPDDGSVTESPQASADRLPPARVKVMVLSQSSCRLLSQSVSR